MDNSITFSVFNMIILMAFFFVITAMDKMGYLDKLLKRSPKNGENADENETFPEEFLTLRDFPCAHREYCGGCTYNGMKYEETMSIKEKEVLGYFDEKPGLSFSKGDGGTDIYKGFRGCPPSWRYRYRNKMEYTFGDFVKDGPLELGMHKKGNFMSIVTVDQCQLVSEDFNKILRYTLDFCRANGLTHYNKKSHRGVLRNLIIRKGEKPKELLVDIVTSSQADETIEILGNERKKFDAATWKDGLLKLSLDDQIVGVMHTINDNIADAVNCDEQRIIFGRDYYMEEICGLKFKVNIFSFFQTNVSAVERLYSEAIKLLPDIKGKAVYDLFCGTGTISQIVAKDAKEAIGVEIVQNSVDAAIENAELNGIKNCKFICGDVFDVLDKESEEVSIPAPDVIIVDPPRAGLGTKTVNKIASYGISEILYISCNPKTLAEDLGDFSSLGYNPAYIKAYDNFPWTRHVETVVLMTKK